MTQIEIQTNAPQETQQIGRVLGQILLEMTRSGNLSQQIIALQGELGAGKTTFTQGFASGLGITEHVTSPTFTLVNEYETSMGCPFVHVDSYRLGDLTANSGEEDDSIALDAATFGLEEILDDGQAIVVIEWADRVASLLGDDYLRVELGYLGESLDGRRLVLKGVGHQSVSIVSKMKAEMM